MVQLYTRQSLTQWQQLKSGWWCSCIQGNHSHSDSNWNMVDGAVVYKAITHTVTATEIWVVVQLYTRQSLTQWQQLKYGWWCSCIQGNHSHSDSNWNLGDGAVVYKAITHTVTATEIWVVVQLYTRQTLTQWQQLKSGWWCSCVQGNHSHSDSNLNLGGGAVYTRQTLTQWQQLKSGWWCSCIQGNHSHSDSNWNMVDGAVVYKAITHTVTAT